MEGNLYGYEIKKKIVESLEDYVDIKFGSIYYAIKKAMDKGWLKRVGTEKESGNPERYIYEILPAGKKYYKKLLKQYFDQNFIHFDIDIVLMFLKYLTKEQKQQFIDERTAIIKEKLDSIKDRLGKEKELPEDKSNVHILTYIESHLKAELAWLKSIISK